MSDPAPNTAVQSQAQGADASKANRSSGRTNRGEGGSSGRDRNRPRTEYQMGKLLGNGSFGVVIEATAMDTGDTVAIKKVLQDPRYKNRELDIMKVLRHPNVVELKDYYYTEAPGEREGEKFLHVVMEFIPETAYRVVRSYVRNNSRVPMILVKVYVYQMCRALGYLHSLGICHRDIKPQNLLVDTRSHVLKLCDFGSAKRLIPGEQSVAYICSRYYRAPELMLGATEYTTAIDIWSIGCVLGEMLLGRPLFAGETSVDQLVKIIQTMGTPTREQMQAMNPNYTEFRFPDVKPRPWQKVFGSGVPAEGLDLIAKLLKYEPNERLKAYDALSHEFFDELRQEGTRLPNSSAMPELFTLTDDELEQMAPEHRTKVVPDWFSRS
ncbi:unnamed protein product [Vitrella brassicaformis CCMP3155]|uniref:Protein kinase domain-containing protein n=1 Tax=Vitrella brassicaformis (strain CCMP3155) TaxID=1169540 RepID=A0A0G4FBJ2_VITBC|nr:unnamed protein product [Vitrella brassicaformis CCMP3155]|mmetsp:Transcript_6745/g.16387  ORF Transcript_6745/g.16387 Transcript_6745/m.16387 type:complete len:381 (-) Transcript_6745:709-1851(-)|eukprot:CEM10291.1 unnamed protein product [Vitrella brassicaformis CCMP3155]